MFSEDEIIQYVFDENPLCDCGEHMYPVGDTDEFVCPCCGAKWDLLDYELHGPYSNILRPIFGPDDPGEGCIACGNPAYPNCKSSCGLFDD